MTGNIGSGKTLVSSVFKTLGIPVYHADTESKKFLTDKSVKNELIERFGNGILNASGDADRQALASIVFNDPEALNFLTSILHPLVREDFRKWFLSQKDHPYVIHEAAIIFESGFEKEFDKIIHVSCPQELAIRRIMERDGFDRQHILKRMQFQWEDQEKAALSDFVIRNDGTVMIVPQVLEIHRILSEGTP